MIKEEIELQLRLQKQSQQIKELQEARKKYAETLDLPAFIAFWENLWGRDEFLLRGARCHFELADLYIKAGRYDDALAFVRRLKANTEYTERAENYEAKIQKLMRKK